MWVFLFARRGSEDFHPYVVWSLVGWINVMFLPKGTLIWVQIGGCFFVCLLFISFSPSPSSSLSSSHSPSPPLTHTYTKMVARVGKIAPAFKATAVVDGAFQEVSLDDYKGQYVVLFFYPLDFTYVFHLHRISRTPLSHTTLPLCPLHAVFTFAALYPPLPHNLCARSDNV